MKQPVYLLTVHKDFFIVIMHTSISTITFSNVSSRFRGKIFLELRHHEGKCLEDSISWKLFKI